MSNPDIDKIINKDTNDEYLLQDTTARGDIQSITSDLSDKMDKVNPTGSGPLSVNRKENTTVGDYSTALGLNNEASGYGSFAVGIGNAATGYGATAEGYESEASGIYSHSEGEYSQASGDYSHAEGDHTQASGDYSHAEGGYTGASGLNSHAEGLDAVASGDQSHAEGEGTEAAGENQHVSGKYNVVDNADAYAEIIGNGTDENNRSNARMLDWQGNETIAGEFYFNGNQAGLSSLLSDKQDTLTPGNNIQINNGTISATDTKPGAINTDNTPAAISVASSNDWQCLLLTPIIEAAAGELWLFEIAAEFQSNATGLRGIGLSNSNTTAPSVIFKNQHNAVSGAVTDISLTSFAQPTNGANYYIWVRQNSGSNLNVTYRYRTVKLS